MIFLRSRFKMFDHVTISVSGIGSFYPTEESVLASPDFMSTEDLEMLKQENVSGDIALRFFDHDGQECNTTLKERMISISMEQFKKIDRKISLVSGVSKANAVLSALKGGLVDVLILDSAAATSSGSSSQIKRISVPKGTLFPSISTYSRQPRPDAKWRCS